MGSVTPLIAIWQRLKIKDPNLEVLFVGTKKGPENAYVKNLGINYQALTAGKFRRYFSGWNIVDFFKVIFAFFHSIVILRKFKPDLILTAGSFICVPLTSAAKILGIPYLIHQQDIEVGLANKMMARGAKAITVTFEQNKKYFDQLKTILTSNPVRQEFFSITKEQALQKFNLTPGLKTILILGGGTGAVKINELVLNSLADLAKDFQVIHSTGAGKDIAQQIKVKYNPIALEAINKNYRGAEFLDTAQAFNAADLVISRPGLATLTELAALAKPTVLITPANNAHQLKNAQYFAINNAAVVISEENLTPESFYFSIRNLLNNAGDLNNLSNNIKKMIDPLAADKYADLVISLLKK